MPTKHDKVAKDIANKNKVEYNKGQGPDVQTPNRVIEVETKDTASDGLRQLQGFTRKVYIAGADAATTKAALEAAKGTTVGVMDSKGNIVKRSTRGSSK